MRISHPITVLLLAIALWYGGAGGQALAQDSLFNMREQRSENLVPFPKWTGVLTRYSDQQKIADTDCAKVRYHPCVIKDWKMLLHGLEKKPLREQLNTVNDWANAHPYILDQINWGVEDFWETPYEFMEVSGDCEDYAIAKYYSLRALGISPNQLRVMIVQDFNLGGVIHAILGVYDGSELLILDNQSKQVTPALGIYHYRPIYGINETAWWAYFPK